MATTYPAANKTRRGGRVPVRGTCAAGHVTETTSDPGRITWDGPCQADGCSHRIHAKRVPSTAPAPQTEVHTPAEPDEDEIREVSYDQPVPRRGRAAAAARDVPGGGPAGAPAVDVDERTPEPVFERGPEPAPTGIIDESGPELVDRTPAPVPVKRRERAAFRLPWER